VISQSVMARGENMNREKKEAKGLYFDPVTNPPLSLEGGDSDL
jgi:hypothetical protein